MMLMGLEFRRFVWLLLRIGTRVSSGFVVDLPGFPVGMLWARWWCCLRWGLLGWVWADGLVGF